MSYTQNNPFSRKSSPLNDDQWIQKATADIKKRGTEGVCTGDKFGSESCPPGSKRYNLAKTFEEIAKNRKGGPSRESSEQPWGGNKDDYKRRDVDGVMKKIGDVDGHYKDYEAPSRKSSSPLNQDERSGHTFLDKVKGTAQNIGSYLSDVPGKLRQKNIGFMDTDYDLESPGGFHSSGKGRGQFKSKKDAEAYRLARSAQERKDRVSAGAAFFRKSSSPVNYSGLAGVNEDDILTDIESGRGESNWQAHHGDKKGVAPSRHGSMTGDQSAKSDYANFKDTDPNYHGHDGESHEDQSATRRDYMGNMGRHHIDPRTKK